MTKILYVITKSNWGGAQRYVYDLASSLPKDEFESAVAFGGTGGKDAGTGQLGQRLSQQGIRTIHVRSFMRDISIFKEFAAFLELFRIIRNEHPDIVHLNSSKAGGIGALAARLLGVNKIIFTSHGWAFNEDRPRLSRVTIKFLQWLNVILAHRTICVSHFDADQVKNWPLISGKVVVIHNGISPMTFGSGDRVRSQFPAGTTITGTIGELIKNKNQQALIEEARHDASMFVAIVGEGEDRTMLEDKIKRYDLTDRVKLLGFIPASEALPGFDKYKITSIKEGLPYVLLEAKLAGLSIEGSRVGGIGEVLDCSDPKEFTLERMVQRTKEIYTS
jgi:glycosyltransferase involved in cell wall biosynthesis